jgi:ATP synthase subunit 6
MIKSPLEQFEVYSVIPLTLGNIDISITNATIYILLVLVCTLYILHYSIIRIKYYPRAWQAVIEDIYNFLLDLIRQNSGEQGKRYFTVIYTIFWFILVCNLLGMLPYSFTVTSHIVVTLSLSFGIWLGVTIIGFQRHGLQFLKIFVPSGAPTIILPLLVVLEILSYCMRAISLGVRLFANIMSGHTLLKIITGFSFKLYALGGIIGIISSLFPLVIVFVITALEIGIAILQAYVFTVLTIMYLNDSLNLH